MARATEYYERDFTQLRERLIRVLGMPTVDRLIERSAVEIARVHPAAGKVRIEEGEITFEEMRRHLEQASEDDIRNEFTALIGVLLLLVARLLGREIAHRLTEDLSVAELVDAGLLGIQ